MKKTIYILVGLKGAGKTTLARYLHTTLGYTMYDVDEILLQHYQRRYHHDEALSVREMYAQVGKRKFRVLEYRTLRSLIANVNANVASANVVIATGGGIIDNRQSYRLLRHCVTPRSNQTKNYRFAILFLELEPNSHFKNLRSSGNIPPYLANHPHPQEAWLKLADRRIQRYSNIATERVDAATVISKPSQIKQLFSHSAV